ncbi:hypothetical protein EU546_05150 [Candidatus Thorarchaeota archaeon]|nr:MAG: hypothetical protein EU546_05150 [Candidatus Thorarchaeota archaeon]
MIARPAVTDTRPLRVELTRTPPFPRGLPCGVGRHGTAGIEVDHVDEGVCPLEPKRLFENVVEMHEVSLQAPELRVVPESHCHHSAHGTPAELLVPVEVVEDTIPDGGRVKDAQGTMDDTLTSGKFLKKEVVRFLPETGEMHHRDVPLLEEAGDLAGQVPSEGRVSNNAVPHPLLIKPVNVLGQQVFPELHAAGLVE